MNAHPVAALVDSRRAKLAGRAAEQIIADVMELGWPVGHVLGSEAELIERYGISRAVLREAIRLVEHQRVARMRRGPGGGLVVEEPDINAVISPVISYLLRVQVTLDEVLDARLVLEELVAESAARYATEDHIGLLRDSLEAEADQINRSDRVLHMQLASLTNNPLLILFVDILARISDFFFSDAADLPPEVARQVRKAHAGIAEAVLANNPGLARERMRRHLLAEAQFIRQSGPTVQRLPASAALDGSNGNKRAEAVARDIFTYIVNADLQPGDFVGLETSLMSDQAVGRAVLREAIRLLEYHQIALMRRGPGGGLFVAAPDPAATTDIVAIYLRRRGITQDHFIELSDGLELAVLDRVGASLASNDNEATAKTLSAYLEGTTSTIDGHPGVSWHSMLASCCGNRALELVHRVTMRLGWVFFSRMVESDPAARKLTAPASFEPAHQSITEALLGGDTELARMRMRAHLAAVRGDKR